MKCLNVDHTVTTFTVTIRHLSILGCDDIKQLLQKKYEVVDVTQQNQNHFTEEVIDKPKLQKNEP